MKIVTSKINPDYTVTIYPVSQYRGGNGYFYTHKDSVAIEPVHVPENVKNELKPIAEKIWSE